MTKRIKIAKRHNDLPTPRFPTAMTEVNSQTPRGAAIAGAAYLDLLLRSAIEKLMRDDHDIQTTLFENRGGLQGFSTRIQLGYALKIYEWQAYQDLSTIRDIRNAFAHSAEKIDFDREDVALLCNRLWFPEHVDYWDKPKPTDPRSKFIRGVELMADGLLEEILQHSLVQHFLQMGPKKPMPVASPKEKRMRRSQNRPAN